MNMDENALLTAFGGLLHDIGKFMQRAELENEFPEIKNNYAEFCKKNEGGFYGYLHTAHTAYFIEKYIPESILDNSKKKELYNAAHHHVVASGDIYREADCTSAGMERYSDEADNENDKNVRLRSIFDLVELKYRISDNNKKVNSRWQYKLDRLDDKKPESLYPVILDAQGNPTQNPSTYKKLWNQFIDEFISLRHEGSLYHYFIETYGLLEKYLWCIPSATNAFPDISLFDHLRTTSSIATCYFYRNKETQNKDPDFILYTGDISGIQDYIFKISKAQGVGGISKRLRGRSFYIAMLAEIISRHIVSVLELTVAHINFCGGGNLEILLPNTPSAIAFLDALPTKINQWLMKEFHGSLGYVDAFIEMTKDELENDYSQKKDELTLALQQSKIRKNKTLFEQETFWIGNSGFDSKITVCPSCNLKVIKENETICHLCEQDKSIGEFLPKADHLLFLPKNENPSHSTGLTVVFGEFGSIVLIGNLPEPLKPWLTCNAAIYGLSERSSIVVAQYHLARTLPQAARTIQLETEKDEDSDGMVHEGQTLSFSTIADMSEGDKRIGILKMDVDHLGLIFSIGLDTEYGIQRSISRLSTLSRMMSLFFTSIIDDLCRTVFLEWLYDEKNLWEHKKDVSQIFYLIFSGGDDLVIVGPWDRIIDLARKIRKQFKEFTCHNPNITISAGIYITKPKFPISFGVEKAEAALGESKRKGRNRITVMGETVVWDKEDTRSRVYQPELKPYYPNALFEEEEITSEKVHVPGSSKEKKMKTLTFEDLCRFADKLKGYYEHEKKIISRQFIYKLLTAKNIFFKTTFNADENRFEETQNMMVLPHLTYTIERNVANEYKNDLKQLVITGGDAQEYVRQAYYPCKSVLMKTKR